jgi:hypothetical protein
MKTRSDRRSLLVSISSQSFLGERDLHQRHDGTLTSFIAWRRQPVKVKRESGKVWVKQVKTKTVNLDLSLVRRILNLAARKWRDEQGLTWLETAPLISVLKVRDARTPYPPHGLSNGCWCPNCRSISQKSACSC